MYGVLSGISALLAIMFFLAMLFNGFEADHPKIVWSFILIFGFGVWYFQKKEAEIEAEERWEKQKQTDERLKRLPNYKSTQKYSSQNGDVTLSIDENSRQISFVNTNFYKDKMYKYGDILKSEILNDGISVTSTNRGSQIGGALLGGLLAGGVGAIIGGLSGAQTSHEKVKKIELNVIVNDSSNPIHKIAFLDSQITSYAKDSQEYKDAYNKAYHCHQLIGVLIRQADDEDRQKEKDSAQSNVNSQQGISVADELIKLQQLKVEGILTGEEFDMQKKRLIEG